MLNLFVFVVVVLFLEFLEFLERREQITVFRYLDVCLSLNNIIIQYSIRLLLKLPLLER